MSQYDQVLRRALVTEAICNVDRSDTRYIQNPYGSSASATIQAVAGTYSVASWTVTDDTLTVSDEVIVGEHIFHHEQVFATFDIAKSRIDEMTFAVAAGIDKYVLNALTEDATGTYTTPTGGFNNKANVITILASLLSKVTGYEKQYKGTFLVLEDTDTVGLMEAQATNGFSMADTALKNGLLTNYMGVDIYITRSGTFVDATLGSRTVTNSGHRVFGVKNVATYASPRGVVYEEKKVSGKTGREIAVVGLVGFKLWTQKASLVVDITLA